MFRLLVFLVVVGWNTLSLVMYLVREEYYKQLNREGLVLVLYEELNILNIY